MSDREASPDVPPINFDALPKTNPWGASNSRATADPSVSVANENAKSKSRATEPSLPAASATTKSNATATTNPSARVSVRPSTATTRPVGSGVRPVVVRPAAGGAGGAPRPVQVPNGPTPRPADLAPAVVQQIELSNGIPLDVSKYVKEVAKRRSDATFLRVLPKLQQLHMLVAQEEAARGVVLLQEQTFRLGIENKRAEESLKKQEQNLNKVNKDTLETYRKQQQEELNSTKNSVTEDQKALETEIKERLAPIAKLQPRLNIPTAVWGEIKGDSPNFNILAQLLDLEKNLAKSVKGDVRYNKTKTAEQDGGALPWWFRQIIAASFNAAAIMQKSELRASVEDVSSIQSKALTDKKIIVVRDASGTVAWAQTRNGPDPAAIIETFIASPTRPAELPEKDGLGILMTKDECAEVLRKSKAPSSELSTVADQLTTVLKYGGVSSFEFTNKEILAIGEIYSA